MSRSTDVPASLAGYYYQLLLAGRELIYLLNDANVLDTDGVGIEQGSDIRIFREDGIYMEAKFYKDKYFTKNHPTIRHTICNFYRHFQKCMKAHKKTGKYQYVTNVPISKDDAAFFANWPKNDANNFLTYEYFVLKCVVSESITKVDRFKEAFKQFKDAIGEGLNEDDYKQKLYEALENDPSLYGQYCERLESEHLKLFIRSIEFHFAPKHQTKLETVQSIKNDARNLLRSACSGQPLTDQDFDHIFRCILDALFVTTVQKGNSYIEIKEIKAIIKNHAEYQIRYLNTSKMKDAVEAVEEEIELLIDFLNNEYKGTRADDILLTFNELIEKLFASIEEHGRSLDELIRSYTFNKKGLSINQVTSLLRPISVLAVFLNREPQHLKLSYPESIINFRLSENEPFILKEAGTLISNRQIITEFIRETLDNAKDLNYDVQVIFGSSLQPCQVSKEFIESFVMDISEVSQNDQYHELYRNLTYKCTKCLHPGETDECMHQNVCNFINGVCS